MIPVFYPFFKSEAFQTSHSFTVMVMVMVIRNRVVCIMGSWGGSVVPLMASNVPVHITHTRPPAHDDDGDDDDDDDDDFSLHLSFIRTKTTDLQ